MGTTTSRRVLGLLGLVGLHLSACTGSPSADGRGTGGTQSGPSSTGSQATGTGASGQTTAATAPSSDAGDTAGDGGTTGGTTAGSTGTGGSTTWPSEGHEDCAHDIATGEKLGAYGLDLHAPYPPCDWWPTPPQPTVGDRSLDLAPLPAAGEGLVLHTWGVEWNPAFDDVWLGLDGTDKWSWEIDLDVDTYPGHLPASPDESLACSDAIGNAIGYACLPTGSRNWPNLWAFFVQKSDVCTIWDPDLGGFAADGIIEDDAENGAAAFDVAGRAMCMAPPTRALDLFRPAAGWPGWTLPPLAIADAPFTWQLVDGTYDEVEDATLLPVRVRSDYATVPLDALYSGMADGSLSVAFFVSGIVDPGSSTRFHSYWRDVPTLAGKTIAVDWVSITNLVFTVDEVTVRGNGGPFLSGPCRDVVSVPGGFRQEGVCRKAIAFRTKPTFTIDPAGEPDLWLDVGAMPGASFFMALVVGHVVP